MRKFLFASIITLFSVTVGLGQISLRPQVGINFPSLTKELVQGKFKGNAGFQFGADLLIGGTFYIQPGLNFQTTSLTLKEVGDMNISRINIPVYVGVRLGEGDSKAFGFRVFAGPDFGIHVNERLDDSLTFITPDNIKNSQISGVAGLGADIGIIFIDAAYKFGLSKFFKDIESDAFKNIFIVNAGIRLGF